MKVQLAYIILNIGYTVITICIRLYTVTMILKSRVNITASRRQTSSILFTNNNSREIDIGANDFSSNEYRAEGDRLFV